jgi:peptide/nickel transport system substrate-binding protein
MAFAHAINKQELLDGVVLGLGARPPARSGRDWADNPKVKGVAVRPQEGGRPAWPRPGWTTRNDGPAREGRQAVHVRALTNQGNDERKKVAEIVQASLRDLGVGVDIRILEWAALLKEHVKKRTSTP